MQRSAASTPTRRPRPAMSSRWSARPTAPPSPGATRPATCRTSRSTRSSPIRSSRSKSLPAPTGACTTPTTSPRRLPIWSRFENGLPHAMIWDMQYRSRLYHAFSLDAQPRRLCLAAALGPKCDANPTPTATPGITPTPTPPTATPYTVRRQRHQHLRRQPTATPTRNANTQPRRSGAGHQPLDPDASSDR